MKKTITLFAACCVFAVSFATDRYVSTSGDNSNDGLSWAKAKATISSAVSSASSGDNIYVGAGIYNEMVSVKDGVNMLGGYNPATGERDIDAYKTILDGTDLNKYLIVKYDNDCTTPTLIEGFTIQNAEHSSEGGGAFIRGNMTLNLCTITNCKGSNGGGVYVRSKDATIPGYVTNSVIELCSAESSGGAAYLYENAVMENCIIRGCAGKYGAIRSHKAGVIVRNCVLHNNAATVDGWPDSGGLFNEDGAEAYNLTVCNNYGAKYAGIHSVGKVYNSVFWGNKAEDGFTDPVNFISASSASSDNWADQGFDSESFASLSLAANNTAAGGPNFKFPTTFVGLPKNAGEIAAMRSADFSLTAASPLINKGNAAFAPAYDIEGKTRPIGTGVEIGAYEFDPDAPTVNVTGVSITVDTLFIVEEQIDGLVAIVTPKNATNKRVTWSIANPAVATIDENGAVTGVTVGNTIATVKTVDGNFSASAVVVVNQKPPVIYPNEVLAADTLYPIENYTIPSYIPFWIAREGARLDSLTTDHALIAAKLKEMDNAIKGLISKEEPYNIIANINGDPSTRMAFCWFTNEGITEGKVQIVEGDVNEQYFDDLQNVIEVEATPTTTKPLRYAVSSSGILKAAKMEPKTSFKYVSHKAIAENLKPGTQYTWRVGYNGHWSELAHFQTKAVAEGEFSFVYMSDSHIMDQEYVDNARWCAEAVAKNESDARFCVFPGDFVETGTNANSEWEWERWFEESIKPVIMSMPVVPTDGNHDDSDNLNYTYHFNTDNQFNKQAKTKPQFDGITYSFVYGDVLFLVYSLQDWWRASGSSAEKRVSSYLSNDLANWFREQVAAHPDTKYRVTLAHKNIFSGSGHSVDDETPMFRDIMLPIFKQCEIDLALQGHDHTYEVIGPVNPDTRTAIKEAISDVTEAEVNTNTNMTGKEGGTFVTDDGTLYYIGATCGRKRYYPYSRETMEANYDKHKVTNYFDLFTSRFGQPGSPCYTRVTVNDEALTLEAITANSSGDTNLFNTIKVVRNKPHTIPAGFEDIQSEPVMREGKKFVRDGQIFIRHNNKIYNIFGAEVE